jgi:hypothetical protein
MSQPIYNKRPPRGSYVVLNVTLGGAPTVYHDRLSDAKAEAERMSKLHPDHVFSVLYVSEVVVTERILKTSWM